jgi:hypothetical protein
VKTISNKILETILGGFIADGFNRSINVLKEAGALDTTKMLTKYKGVGTEYYDLVTKQIEHTTQLATQSIQSLLTTKETDKRPPQTRNAQSELDRLEQVIQLLDKNVRQAIRVSSHFERAAYLNPEVKAYFDQSLAANGYNQVMDSLYFELILTMARLYDNPRENSKAEKTASVPVAASILALQDVQETLKVRLLERHDMSSTLGADPSDIRRLNDSVREDVDQRLLDVSKILDDCRKIECGHLVQRIRNARNDLLAHTSISPASNNKLTYGDAEDLLKSTQLLIARLQSVVRSCHISYQHESDEATKLASIFWERVINGKTIANQPSKSIAAQ